MTYTRVRADIDGDLVHCTDAAPGHYAKSLPASVAWHVLDPRDLQDAARNVVESVTTDFNEYKHWIHYRPELEPLDLLQLRDLVQSNGPLAPWRAAKLALELAKQLKALHDAEIWQLLVLPGRVARVKNQLVLMPTLAGMLAPLSQALLLPHEGWLHYIAPELLRTRGMRKDMLAAGDVYALGRLLEAMCVSTPADTGLDEPFDLARRRVELLDRDPFGEWSAPFAPLRDLARDMCAPLPPARPSLPNVVSALEQIVMQNAPETVFAGCRPQQQVEAARDCYRDFTEAYDERLFGISARDVHIMAADLALMQSPPDCNTAVYELEQAESLNEYEVDTQYRLGRAYAMWSSLPNHLQLSFEAYRRAARLSGWKATIIEEWITVLRNGGPTSLLQHSEDIPFARWPAALVELRARSLMELGNPEQAWEEVALSLPRFSSHPALFKLAQEIASNLAPATLLSWKEAHEDWPGLELAQAIVWFRSGNPEMGARCLEQAAAAARTGVQ
jgi:hypothetical protein